MSQFFDFVTYLFFFVTLSMSFIIAISLGKEQDFAPPNLTYLLAGCQNLGP
jgi:hypothetical protein